ncbi:MAG: TIGR00725 family protein [Dehalococcoidia bacterium]|nr:TIGR00725 family protein [Dehalococcoidia bacterium]
MDEGTPPLLISVIGSSSPTAQGRELARQVGRLLAERGVVLVCGGLSGIMEAACQGAWEAGGLTIGILPGNDPRDANPYVRIPICTDLGYARNVIVVKSGKAVIAIEGAYGTRSEIAHALGDGIPVIGLGTWSFSVKGKKDRQVVPSATPEEAVAKALEAAGKRRPPLPRRRLIIQGSKLTRAASQANPRSRA